MGRPWAAAFVWAISAPPSATTSSSDLVWRTEPATVKILLDQQDALPSSGHTVDLAAQPGECESAQVWLRSEHELTHVTVGLADLPLVGSPGSGPAAAGAGFSQAHWQAEQQLYVDCKAVPVASYIYPAPGGGWKPDPLLPIPMSGIRVPAATTQPLLLSACVPPQQPPGVYAGAFRLKALDNTTLLTVEIPVRLEVWPLPPLLETDHPDAFSTLFRFDERDMVSFYPSYDVTGAANASTQLAPGQRG